MLYSTFMYLTEHIKDESIQDSSGPFFKYCVVLFFLGEREAFLSSVVMCCF